MLLGSADLVRRATVWQRRLGGNLYSLMPNLVTAQMLLDERLAAMPAWLERARALAAALSEVPGIRILPDPPHTNLFHVLLDLDPTAARQAQDRVVQATGIRVLGGLREGLRPGTSRFELYVGEATMAIPVAEARDAMAALFE